MKVHVSPNGNDNADGAADAPVRTLHRAQALVRGLPRTGDIDVVLADGTYTLDQPLAFSEADGGNGRQITWKAAEGANVSRYCWVREGH